MTTRCYYWETLMLLCENVSKFSVQMQSQMTWPSERLVLRHKNTFSPPDFVTNSDERAEEITVITVDEAAKS